MPVFRSFNTHRKPVPDNKSLYSLYNLQLKNKLTGHYTKGFETKKFINKHRNTIILNFKKEESALNLYIRIQYIIQKLTFVKV